MSRIAFDSARPVVESDPARMDVACFVGLARATGTALPGAIQDWLQTHGWTDGPAKRSVDPPFTDIPIPIDSYAAFTALFDPGGSPVSFGTDYLAAAVRSFFAQGGRRCYVVRMDDPLSPADSVVVNGTTGKAQKLTRLLAGQFYAADDRRSWHGIGHLGGLPDVSFLAVPDLPVLSASDPSPAPGISSPPTPDAAQFRECQPPVVAPAQQPLFLLPAPRLTIDDYKQSWSTAMQSIVGFLYSNGIREIQFVAAFPLPREVDAATAAVNPSAADLAQDVHAAIAATMHENILPTATEPPDDPFALSTAFLQLAYPWLTTTGSWVLNESLEPPDGALVGILARNALTRGAFMNATKIVPSEISDVWPLLPAPDLSVPTTPLSWGDDSWKPLIIRLSLFGFTPAGLRLLSDVTAYPGEAYRPARVHRLVAVISRAARQLGERIVFQRNGPAVWSEIEKSLGALMTQLWMANALDGATVQDAFSVRCDTSTMTQNDLDNGRLIAEVTFTAADTIELIRVTLGLEASGATAQGIAVMAGVS